MSNCPFCNLDPTPGSAEKDVGDVERPKALIRRAWRWLGWLFPTTLLVLTPKCPMCVAAYVALFTGASISFSTARWIQILSPVVALTTLVYLLLGHNPFFRRSAHVHRTGNA
ncbi:hypothetical protein BH09PLA1_BH09PLA1_32230 [soil metagenome]